MSLTRLSPGSKLTAGKYEDMVSPARARKFTIGSFGWSVFRFPLRLPYKSLNTHWHIIGTSGSGKSYLLAYLFLSLYKQGHSVSLIDPHGDLAKLILAHLVADGAFTDPTTFDRLLVVDLPAAEQKNLFLPFNVLSQPFPPHTLASNIKEAFHRAWPALSGGAAPMFDTLVQDGVKVLISNQLPLTALYRLLTDKAYRDRRLANEDDSDVVAFFHDQFDRLSIRDQADQAGAALRRAHLLTFSPVLKHSLSQQTSVLNFREILNKRQSLILNLALTDAEARRLLGCLLTVSAEQAALSRADLPIEQRSPHHLLIDEFSEFTAQSEEALARMLSQTRKFGLFLKMAHQTWSQTSQRLRGALQNVGVEVAFRLGREDAEYTARMMGMVDPLSVKHTVKDDTVEDRTHPVFYSLPEQWEAFTQQLQELKPRRFFCKIPGKRAKSGKSLDMDTHPHVDPHELMAIEEEYLRRYFTPRPRTVPEIQHRDHFPLWKDDAEEVDYFSEERASQSVWYTDKI
jgi:hypothetical protein